MTSSAPPEQEPLVLDPTGADPHAEHRALHARGPATRVDVLGVPAWSVSDPALLKTLLTSPDVSKDGRAHWPAFAETVQSWPLALWVAVRNMFTSYGADHRRLRRIIAPAFSARRVAALRPVVERITAELLDELAALPPDAPVDLREKLAYPLPVAVVGHLMGVPEERYAHFRAVVDGVCDTTLSREEAMTNTGALYVVLDQLIATRRAEPGDDLTSLLLATPDEEGSEPALSHEELRDTLLLVISAGYETTVNVIDQAVYALLSVDGQLGLVRSGRVGWSDVVEETLRHEGAVKHLPLRYAVRDIPLPDGRTIARGEAILASYAAANRHPGWHDDADVFDAGRPGKEHLAFGHGVHFCVGAPLARLEVEVCLRLLFARFPGLALDLPAEGLPPFPSLISNGHRHLPVWLHGAGLAGRPG
ncbi:cytochrome P450 family protein [Streptomyces albidoflavus]|uniref:cytochrome P450 family protein n=1 Tax=Streptomyces albidoflavus TaxID=1886 RepID=UPI0018A006AD|nr:cytochrome P450 [Streptomyces albidoflavus]MCR0986715.1 cytochrome P450 [Streptomyces albidoflavus]